jgi:transcriptional regulator with XRE-family HTH domain
MPDNPRPAYSDRLRALMEAAGESQYKLAEALRTSQPTVARWLTGGSVPFRPMLHRLCAHYGVRPEWLVDGTGPKDAAEPKNAFAAFPKDLRSDLIDLGEAAQRNKDVRQVIAYQARTFRQ